MAVSLEARVPLLTPRIAEFAFSLPEKLLYHGGELKGLLKYAYRDVLPPEILSRRKKGFSIPIGRWDQSIHEDVRVIQQRLLNPFIGRDLLASVPVANA
jgi:asparagine synthetase B (glutamine-hydrolysing)